MRDLPSKKIVLVVSDPGAAQVVLLLVPELTKRGARCVVVARGVGKTIATQRGIAVARVQRTPAALRRFLAREKPDAIITGTSLEDDLERNAIAAGRAFGIPTIAVIDWWIHYKERFVHAQTKKLCLPDWVCVNDARAKRAAQKELGGRVRITVTGNPYFANTLSFDRPTRARHRAVARELGFTRDIPTLFFIAEPRYPPYIDQFAICERIMREIARVGVPINVIVKLHPSDRGRGMIARYQGILARTLGARHAWRVLDAGNIHELIESVDYVWGMNAAPLLEAMVRGKLTSSFLPEVPYLGIPFQKKANVCPSADAWAQFPRLIERLLTDTSFTRTALAKQKKYRLPRDRFFATVVTILKKIV